MAVANSPTLRSAHTPSTHYTLLWHTPTPISTFGLPYPSISAARSHPALIHYEHFGPMNQRPSTGAIGSPFRPSWGPLYCSFGAHQIRLSRTSPISSFDNFSVYAQPSNSFFISQPFDADGPCFTPLSPHARLPTFSHIPSCPFLP